MSDRVHRADARAFLIGIVGLLLLAVGFVLTGAVTIKMLPFDNKSEFQIVLNTPEGTTLEQTTRIATEMTAALRGEPEVRDYQIYAGTSAPFNFNGLVRHSFLRRGPNVADIQVNLVGKSERSDQSHAIARRLRPRLTAIAQSYGANIAVSEVPPGPPVLQSIVAEIYGPSETQRLALAQEVREIMRKSPGVVDVDWFVEDAQPTLRYLVDREQAALHGVSMATINQTIAVATQGGPVHLLHLPAEREDLPIIVDLPAAARADPAAILALNVRADLNPAAPLVPLSELVRIERTTGERNLYRKNLKPVTYVTADVAGIVESPAYALFPMHRAIQKIDARRFGASAGELPI